MVDGWGTKQNVYFKLTEALLRLREAIIRLGQSLSHCGPLLTAALYSLACEHQALAAHIDLISFPSHYCGSNGELIGMSRFQDLIKRV